MSQVALRNFYIFLLSSTQALSMSSFVFAPVKTTFPEANIKADLTFSICLQTTPGKFQLRTTLRSQQSFPISILQPKSALATIFVTLKSAIFSFKFKAFVTSLMAALAAFSASDSLSEPIIIILPDLNTKIVLFGFVFLIITAGNLFLLYLHPQAFYAISLRSKTSVSVFILAKETTFWTKGVFVPVWLFQVIQ